MPTRQNSIFWLLALGALSFLPTLFFYLVGEEGIYVITSMEMRHGNVWMQQIMYGVDNGRPPLLNWFTLPLTGLVGWSHAIEVLRFFSVAATLGTIAWLYWLSRKLFNDRSFALFAALTSLCLADLLLYRGWLSYLDPVFAFFTFGSIATLWVACLERRRGWLLLSVALVSCALITKAFTAYVFYGTAGLVLLFWQRETRGFLLSPRTLAVFALVAVVPILWFASIPHSENSEIMLDEIMRKLSAHDLAGYVGHLAEFPLEVMLRLSPAVALAIYLLLRKRVSERELEPAHFRNALLIAAFGFLPYWLSPQSGIRYLLPIYPLIALVCARIIWRSGDAGRTLAIRWFVGMIAFKFLFVLVLFPYYQTHYRGKNYEQAAHAIIKRTQGFPLYTNDVRSVGLSIAGYIDIKRFPQAPLTYPPDTFDSGFVLSMDPKSKLGEVIESYSLAAEKVYLLCRGMACAAVPRRGD